MATKYRGEVIGATDQVVLTVQYKDHTGTFVDTDSYPTISIVEPNGSVIMSPTTVGVTQLDTGKYSYTFTVPYNPAYGNWMDVWEATIDGYYVESNLNFLVLHTQVPMINTDGYVALGDDPGFNYSQAAIMNINKLLKMLRARLNSSGKSKSTDEYGNVIYVTCDIYSIDMLVTFLGIALSDFNQTPYFTFFQFDDDSFIAQFGEVLVEGATLYSLASQALIERGREFSISDNGLNFTPPTVSELLNTQYSALLSHYWEKLKYIKNSLRPAPLGLGAFNMQAGNSSAVPQIRRLRFLRERTII